MATPITISTCEAESTTFSAVLADIYPEGSARLCVKENINKAFLSNCFVAMREGKVVGRCCTYVNPSLRSDDRPYLLVGNFECVEDYSVAQALLQHVFYIHTEVHPAVIGPMNGSSWDEYRFPLHETKDPFLSDCLQPAYYATFFRQYGFEIMHRYHSSISDNDGSIYPSEEEIRYLQQQGISIRGINLQNYEAELEEIYKLCDAAFAGNVLYSPITQQQFIAKYSSLKPLLDSRYVLIAEDEEGAVAVYLCFADAYQPGRLVAKTIAKHPRCHVKGVIDIMGKVLYQNAYKQGYTNIVHAFMHESNRSVRLSENFDGSRIKEYALFIKPLD